MRIPAFLLTRRRKECLHYTTVCVPYSKQDHNSDLVSRNFFSDLVQNACADAGHIQKVFGLTYPNCATVCFSHCLSIAQKGSEGKSKHLALYLTCYGL
jgi:hypothetical protein